MRLAWRDGRRPAQPARPLQDTGKVLLLVSAVANPVWGRDLSFGLALDLVAANQEGDSIIDPASNTNFGDLRVIRAEGVAFWDLDHEVLTARGFEGLWTVGEAYTHCAWVHWRTTGWQPDRALFRGDSDQAIVVHNTRLGMYTYRGDPEGFRDSGYDVEFEPWNFVCVVGNGTSKSSSRGTSKFYVATTDSETVRWVGTVHNVISGTKLRSIGAQGQYPGKLAMYRCWNGVALAEEDVQAVFRMSRSLVLRASTTSRPNLRSDGTIGGTSSGGAPLAPPASGPQGTASVLLRFVRLDYPLLLANEVLLSSFTEAVRESIAKEAGLGTTPDDVQVQVSAGSASVRATVVPTRGVLAKDLRLRLNSSRTLGKSVLLSVIELNGLGNVSTGTVEIEEVAAPLHRDDREVSRTESISRSQVASVWWIWWLSFLVMVSCVSAVTVGWCMKAPRKRKTRTRGIEFAGDDGLQGEGTYAALPTDEPPCPEIETETQLQETATCPPTMIPMKSLVWQPLLLPMDLQWQCPMPPAVLATHDPLHEYGAALPGHQTAAWATQFQLPVTVPAPPAPCAPCVPSVPLPPVSPMAPMPSLEDSEHGMHALHTLHAPHALHSPLHATPLVGHAHGLLLAGSPTWPAGACSPPAASQVASGLVSGAASGLGSLGSLGSLESPFAGSL